MLALILLEKVGLTLIPPYLNHLQSFTPDA
jgi:hypothetical protein